MSQEQAKIPKTKDIKGLKHSSSKQDKIVGQKRIASKRTGTSSDSSMDSKKILKQDTFEKNYDFSDLSDYESSSTNNQLFEIEKKIKQPDLTKREKRLLQNRKSALKCRIKKQEELDEMREKVNELESQNRELKEKLSATNALLQSKVDENVSINKKFSELQFQQTLILISTLSQGNPQGVNRALQSLRTLQQNSDPASTPKVDLTTSHLQ